MKSTKFVSNKEKKLSSDDFETPKSKKSEVIKNQFNKDKKSSNEKVKYDFNKKIVLELIDNQFKMIENAT